MGGPGPNAFGGSIAQQAPSYDPKYDLLSGLVQWVERGIPPKSVIATKYVGDAAQSAIEMQRPLCPYPQFPHYNGTGDSTVAQSYTCSADEKGDFNEKPAPIYGP
jgi:feruloyl esterase